MLDALITLSFTPNIDFTNSPDPFTTQRPITIIRATNKESDPHAAYGNLPRILVDHDLVDALREHPDLLDQINKVVDDVNK